MFYFCAFFVFLNVVYDVPSHVYDAEYFQIRERARSATY